MAVDMIAVDGREIEQRTFPDGTPNLLSMPVPHIGQRHIDIKWCFDNMGELSILYMVAMHYREAYPDIKRVLEMPYVPNARMDRTKNTSECFTLKYMCQMINSLEFERIDVFDPHSDVTTALLDRVHVIAPDDEIARAIEMARPTALCFPDAGAQKRYEGSVGGDVQSGGGKMKVSVGIKERDWETGRIKRYRMSSLPGNGARVLIIDDISSYGGTFVHARKALVDDRYHDRWSIPRDVSLYVSHCEKNIFDGDLFGEAGDESLYRLPATFRLYTTDSILRPEDVPDKYRNRVFFVKRFRDTGMGDIHPTKDEMREIVSI